MNIVISQGIFENGSIFVPHFCMILPSKKRSAPRVNRLIVYNFYVFITEGFSLRYARPQNDIW